MNNPIAKKAYYAIGELCDMAGLKPHVLRYWESQFEVLSPTKNRAGNRVYRPEEVKLVFLIKHLLYDRKFTIDGARQRIKEMRRQGELDEGKGRVLEPQFLAEMKGELQGLLQVLEAPPSEEG